MDTLARSLLVAHAMLDDGVLEGRRDDRYAGWGTGLGHDILSGNGVGAPLKSLHHFVGDTELIPHPSVAAKKNLRTL